METCGHRSVGPKIAIEEIFMQQDRQRGQSPDEPAEGSNDIPPPERGSPEDGSDHQSGEAEEKIEKGEVDDANPLAPPVNTQAGS